MRCMRCGLDLVSGDEVFTISRLVAAGDGLAPAAAGYAHLDCVALPVEHPPIDGSIDLPLGALHT